MPNHQDGSNQRAADADKPSSGDGHGQASGHQSGATRAGAGQTGGATRHQGSSGRLSEDRARATAKSGKIPGPGY